MEAFTAWLPDSPFRVPAWRWARASWLHANARNLNPRIDDNWVARACDFLAATESCARQTHFGQANPCDPAIQAALDLWRSEPCTLRWKVDSYLLTHLSLEEVAQKCSLPSVILDAYENLFFACRKDLAATDWIMLRAIGAGPWNNFAGQPLGALWKYAAYAAGPRALEVVIAITTNAALPEWLRGSFVGNPVFEEARFRTLTKLAVAAMTTNSSEEWAGLVEARQQLRRVDRQVIGMRDEPPSLMPAMEQFLQAVDSGKLPTPKAVTQRTQSKARTASRGKKRAVGKRPTLASLRAGLT